jgi:probable phosphoglycerate mutase
LLRHGASTFNLQHRCQGCSDEPELTPKGREEARLSGERLGCEDIHAVITSPLRRGVETAGEALKTVRAQDRRILSKIDSRLREIELYYWEGLSLNEIPRRFPEQYDEWRHRPDEFRMQLTDGQVLYPVRDLYDRVDSFWDHLLSHHAGESILLVTHGGTIRALISTALGLGPEHFHSFQQSNCGLSRLRFRSGSRSIKVDLLNDTAHLGECLPKLKEGRRGVRLLFIPVTEAKPAVLGGCAAALDGVLIDHVIAVGATARNAAKQLFPSCGDSCLVGSEAIADSIADLRLHQFSEGQLRNVAILGPTDVLRRLLRQQLLISDAAAESLTLCPFEITPVHRPANGVPPVLQSLNMSKPSLALLGV